jgi:hypothetical protein
VFGLVYVSGIGGTPIYIFFELIPAGLPTFFDECGE